MSRTTVFGAPLIDCLRARRPFEWLPGIPVQDRYRAWAISFRMAELAARNRRTRGRALLAPDAGRVASGMLSRIGGTV